MYGDAVWKKGVVTVTSFGTSFYLYIKGQDYAMARTHIPKNDSPSVWARKKIKARLKAAEDEIERYQRLVDAAKRKRDLWKLAEKELE